MKNSNVSCSTGELAFFLPFLLLKRRARKMRETAPKAVAAKSFLVPVLRLTCSMRKWRDIRQRLTLDQALSSRHTEIRVRNADSKRVRQSDWVTTRIT